MTYIDFLKSSAESAGNIMCMGLDPVAGALPGEGTVSERIVRYFEELLGAMTKRGLRPAAFKPNLGYYSALDRPLEGDFSGSMALAKVLGMLRALFPQTPVILDSKRGDIATSSLNYAKEAFDAWQADAVTVSPYMGSDSVMPFGFEGKGMYILCRTSNPGGADMQNLLTDKGAPFYMAAAEKIAFWNGQHPGTGAVAGATNLREFADISSYFSDKEVPLLIPGVGSQGGTAPEVIDIMRETGYPMALARINSSSGLTHPWKKAPVPEDYLERALANIEKLAKETRI